MKFFEQVKEKNNEMGNLYEKLYELNKQESLIKEEKKYVISKILELDPIEGKSQTKNFNGKKYNFKQNYSTPKFTDKNAPFESLSLDEMLEWCKVDVKPKTLKGEVPEKIQKFYEENLAEIEPTSVSIKIEEE